MHMCRLDRCRKDAMALLAYELAEGICDEQAFRFIETNCVVAHSGARFGLQIWIWPDQLPLSPRTTIVAVEPGAMGSCGPVDGEGTGHDR